MEDDLKNNATKIQLKVKKKYIFKDGTSNFLQRVGQPPTK